MVLLLGAVAVLLLGAVAFVVADFRTVRELVRYLAASVNSDCCRRWSSPPLSPSTFHFRLMQAGVLGGGGGCEQFLDAMWVD